MGLLTSLDILTLLTKGGVTKARLSTSYTSYQPSVTQLINTLMRSKYFEYDNSTDMINTIDDI